jgi:hypothetical protein
MNPRSHRALLSKMGHSPDNEIIPLQPVEDDGLEFASGHELDAGSARHVPAEMLGRLLDDGDLRKAATDVDQEETPRSIGAASVGCSPGGQQAMTLVLRKQKAQDRIEGREPLDWADDDYAVVDETESVGFTGSRCRRT